MFRCSRAQRLHTTPFRGCNADPVYGTLTGLLNSTVIDKCAANGNTPYTIPGLFTGDLYCCDKDACNSATPAFPTPLTVPTRGTTTVRGSSGGGGGAGAGGGGDTGGDQHKSAGHAIIGFFTVAVWVAFSGMML